MIEVKVIMNYDNNRVEMMTVDTTENSFEEMHEFNNFIKSAVQKKFGIYDVKEFVILN